MLRQCFPHLETENLEVQLLILIQLLIFKCIVPHNSINKNGAYKEIKPLSFRPLQDTK